MNRPLKRREWVVAGAIVAVLIGFLVVEVNARRMQARAQQAAAAYVARAEPLLVADGRFPNVVVYVFSGYGCARIKGWVATENDMAALRAFIETTTPPANIQMMWSVQVDPNPDPHLKDGFPFPASRPG